MSEINNEETAIFYDIENIKDNKTLKNVLEVVHNDVLKGKKAYMSSAYTDWGRTRDDMKRTLLASGVIPKQVITYGGHIHKNSSDIALCVDVMELLFKEPSVNHYVLVTGDGGFTELMVKLKKQRKKITVVSESAHFGEIIRGFADEVFIVDSEVVLEKTEALAENSTTDIKITPVYPATSPSLDEESDYYKEEATKNYFKTIWAICKTSKTIVSAIYNIFGAAPVKAEINSDEGLKYNVLEKILFDAGGYSKKVIEYEIKRELKNKTTYRISSAIDNQRIFNIVPPQHKNVEKTRITEKELTVALILDKLERQGYPIMCPNKCGQIVEDIAGCYGSFEEQEMGRISIEMQDKFGHNIADAKSILKLMCITKANVVINLNTRFSFSVRVLKFIGLFVTEVETKIISEELFGWDFDSLPRRKKDEEML